MSPGLHIADAIVADAAATARRAADYLLAKQHEQGYWWGHLTADSTLESDYILMQLWSHSPVNGVWNPPTKPLITAAAESILKRQLPDGGVQHLSAWPFRNQRFHQSLFCIEACGDCIR